MALLCFLGFLLESWIGFCTSVQSYYLIDFPNNPLQDLPLAVNNWFKLVFLKAQKRFQRSSVHPTLWSAPRGWRLYLGMEHYKQTGSGFSPLGLSLIPSTSASGLVKGSWANSLFTHWQVFSKRDTCMAGVHCAGKRSGTNEAAHGGTWQLWSLKVTVCWRDWWDNASPWQVSKLTLSFSE